MPIVETAYYYPEPYWLMREGGWIKTLLLFFDEVGILLPEYMRGRHLVADPILAAPLEDTGLLRVIEPESFVDETLANKLTDTIIELVRGGGFDDVSASEGFAELSMSRMGYSVAEDVARRVHNELKRRGLATDTVDGVSIPMNRRVRTAYLLLLAQLARETGARQQLDLHPVTNGPGAIPALKALLNAAPMPSRGNVIALDLEVVSVDLDNVPLDEVLDFRERHKREYRKYVDDLRNFAFTLSMLPEAERGRAVASRRAELEEAAHDLRSRTMAAWTKPKQVGAFALGLIGAAWTLQSGDPVPAVLGAIGAALGMAPDTSTGNAYSYLFSAGRELSR